MFEQLRLLVSKDKIKKNVQDLTYHKCMKSCHYSSQCQLTESTAQDAKIVEDKGIQKRNCYKKQADESSSKPDKGKP